MTLQPARTRTAIGVIVASILTGCLAGPSETGSANPPTGSQLPSAATSSPQPTPTPSATPQPTPDQAKVPIFQAGAMAVARTTVRVRDLPGTQWGVAALLPSGAAMQIVLGPVRTAGYGWYLVRDADPAKPSFTEGWVASGFSPDAFIGRTNAKPPPNGPTFVAGYAGLTTADFGPFRVEGSTALRWAIAVAIGKPSGSSCRFTGTLTPAGGKGVVFITTSASDAPAPGTVQSSFFAQHPTLRGDVFLHVASDCSWAVSVVRLPM